MTTEQEKLIQEPIFQYFHELCQIPRPRACLKNI